MALKIQPTSVNATNKTANSTISNGHFITCFKRMNSGKLAATVLMQKANVVPIGSPFIIKLSITGMTPVALE
jgi:hypothetical protein